MEISNHILAAYPIDIVHVNKITNSLYQLSDERASYALKKSSLTKDTIENWEAVLHKAHTNNLVNILPIYLTKDNKMHYAMDGDYYYLTPWIKTDKSSIEELYRSIGQIHKQTKKTKAINTKEIAEQFNTYKEYCKQSRHNLLNYIDHFEQVRYMSPFELQVCTHFRDVEMIINESIIIIEKFSNELKEEKTWNYSLCHKNLKRSHVLNRTIINWEKATYDHPITDLINLFRNEMSLYDAPEKQFIDLFTTYMEVNKLSKAELYLLTLYLIAPTDYMGKIKAYLDGKKDETMIHQVKILQREYRNLLFGLKWLRYFKQEYEFPFLEEKES